MQDRVWPPPPAPRGTLAWHSAAGDACGSAVATCCDWVPRARTGRRSVSSKRGSERARGEAVEGWISPCLRRPDRRKGAGEGPGDHGQRPRAVAPSWVPG